MTLVQPALDGTVPEPKIPAARRRVEDYEEWVDAVWDAFIEAADTGRPFTISSVAADKSLPDPPKPKYQWGHLPERLLNAGIIRAHSVACSRRDTVHGSLVREWIGVPEGLRQAVAELRAAERRVRAEQRRAAA